MGSGKIASQAGHAYVEAVKAGLQKEEPRTLAYLAQSPGTKVCLSAPGLEHIERLHAECLSLGIPCALITDSGHQAFFNGQPTVTALGIAPLPQPFSLLRKLKLLP